MVKVTLRVRQIRAWPCEVVEGGHLGVICVLCSAEREGAVLMFCIVLWLVLVFVPIIICAVRQKGFRYLLVWEAVMFAPLLVALGLLALFILRPVKFANKELYVPRVDSDRVRDFYLPKWRGL
jgi:hypothetical protein